MGEWGPSPLGRIAWVSYLKVFDFLAKVGAKIDEHTGMSLLCPCLSIRGDGSIRFTQAAGMRINCEVCKSWRDVSTHTTARRHTHVRTRSQMPCRQAHHLDVKSLKDPPPPPSPLFAGRRPVRIRLHDQLWS